MVTTRTEISTIGRENLINRLFENTGYTNERTIKLSEKGECCTSHKILLEGVNFDLVYTPLKHLGYKAALCAMGEIYALLRQPASLSLNLGLSSRFSVEDVTDLWSGFVAAAKEHAIKHLSLELNPSLTGLCISISSSGVQKKGIIAKVPAPKNMDLICLTGNVGAAYMGLHVLQREKVSFIEESSQQPDLSKYKHLLAAYLSPEINPSVVSRFLKEEIYPSAGYFLTRGLGAGVLDLVKDSGFGAKIYLDRIPVSSQSLEMAQEIEMDMVTAIINGGEDYKFIFTVPIEKHDVIRKEFQDYDVIGHLARPEVGAVLVTPEGAELTIRAQGYEASEG